jgi:hypothetical protein
MLKCVIHNPKRGDRWNTFSREVREQGIEDIVVVPSVHIHRRAPMNISEAHKNCVRLAIEEDRDMVMILEDDVRFTSIGSYQEFMSRISLLPPDWNMFLSGVYDGHIIPLDDKVARVKEFSGLHCYIVHKRFYEDFLDADPRINIDKALSGKAFANHTCYLAYPMVAMQYDGFSDNVNRQTNYNSLIQGRFKLWNQA